jgi:phosphoribosyl 1,2-cyclic phosphodiesterase
MPVQFAILASGSRGNAALVKTDQAGVLLDFGLGPKTLENRLASVNASWRDVRSALLTHTHSDHVDAATIGRFVTHGIRLYCHPGHRPELSRFDHFLRLESVGLVRDYDDRPFLTSDGLRVEPIELSHDGGPTFGFRIEGRAERRARPSAVGYVADTGMWTSHTADALADVDVLGVEFNHDVAMQKLSGRSPRLVARNLGNRGHLSNEQGAALIEAVWRRSNTNTFKHVILLHISEQCNGSELALGEAKKTVSELPKKIQLHAACQAQASPNLSISPGRKVFQRREAMTSELPF